MQKYKCRQKNICLPYNYRHEIEKQLIKSLPTHLTATLQASKVIRTVSSILKINLLQCALLSWLLHSSKYTLYDLSDSCQQISLFQQDQNKQLLLLIILNAYYVKSFLMNKNCSPPQIDREVLSLIPNFAKIYKNWRPDSSLQKVSLSQLNIYFSNWTQNNHKEKPDYNNLVNKILQLSKTYNVGANEEQAPKKKRKINEEQSHSDILKQKMVASPKKGYVLRSSVHFRQNNEEKLHEDYDSNIWYLEEKRSSHDFLKKSKNVNNSLSFLNMSDLKESKQLFPFGNVNVSLNKSSSRVLGGMRESKTSTINPKIKITSSFDDIFK